MASVVIWPGVIRKRFAFGGAGYIAGEAPTGIVTVAGVAGAREIEIRHRLTRYVVAVTFSNANGTYRVDDLDPLELFEVRVRDWQGTYRDYSALAYPRAL